MSTTMPFPPPRPRPTGPTAGRPAPKRRRRWPLVLLLSCLLLCCGSSLAVAIGFGAFHSILGGLFSGGSAPGGSTPPPGATVVTSDHVAADFMDAMQKADYARAYGDLDPSLTLDLLKQAFIQQAQRGDVCFGRITSVTRVNVSALSPTSRQYTYTVKRAKLAQAFALHITLSQGVDGSWAVSSYGDALVPPGNPPCQA